jgi:hypothetical protein
MRDHYTDRDHPFTAGPSAPPSYAPPPSQCAGDGCRGTACHCQWCGNVALLNDLGECRACVEKRGAPPEGALRVLVLARIREIGQAEVARRVAPLWGPQGWSPASAASRLTRWMKDPGSPGFKDMSSEALFALLAALGLTITPPP